MIVCILAPKAYTGDESSADGGNGSVDSSVLTAGLLEELLEGMIVESFDKLFVESSIESFVVSSIELFVESFVVSCVELFVGLLVKSLEDDEEEDEAKSFARKSSCFLETFKSRDPTQQST